MKKLILIFTAILMMSCGVKKGPAEVKMQKLHFFDSKRNRDIPVALISRNEQPEDNSPVVIFSHGYGRNTPESNLDYKYLLQDLATEGCAVFSIQHELPTDDLLPLEGNPQVVRRSNWDRGAENIKFVLRELKKKYPRLNYNKVVIAGHSNGGDMSVLFVEKNPDLVWKLITLDQRRYAFPLLSEPKIYSLRSSDQPADVGVIPTLEDQKKWGMTIIKLSKTIHNDMDDSGTPEQKEEVATYFRKFLKED